MPRERGSGAEFNSLVAAICRRPWLALCKFGSAASWARCDVKQLSALALSELASRAPGAPLQVLFFKFGPSGHASPCTTTTSAGDVLAASWARHDVTHRSALALS